MFCNNCSAEFPATQSKGVGGRVCSRACGEALQKKFAGATANAIIKRIDSTEVEEEPWQ